VKTFFIPSSLTTLNKVTVKMLNRLITVFVLLPLLLISQFTSANDISRSAVPSININLGEKIAFYSDNLKEQREFFIRLPEGYQETKRNYPVIYLLDANNETLTYMKDLYFHSVAQIDRLMQQGDIPESIIVGIPFKSSQWFSNVSSNPVPFRNYLTKELSSYISDNYRTANNNMLIGQSYSALFVINALPYSSNTFNSYVAIEPILSSGELEKAVENYKGNSVKSSDLQIIMGGTSFLIEAKALIKQVESFVGKTVKFSLEAFPTESHGSVYYPALNSSMRKHFQDFRKPNKEQILAENFTHQSLLNYFEKRNSKYQVETSDKQFQTAVYSAIYHQLMAKKFEQAFALWPFWKSQYKMYNANIITNSFLRINDHAAAVSFLQHVAIAMPNSVRVLDRLATIYQQDQQPDQANQYRLKVQQRLTTIFKKPISPKQEDSLNRYGYNLLSEERNQEAIVIFKRITQANPDSINAYDSLADAYEAVKDNALAIKALEKSIAIANKKGDVNTASFQQRLSRLKNRNAAD
jgi:predicted alpha/beta superfamily hydrolase/Tfp pilus assembly protein PilF